MYIAISAFFWLPFAWNIFFYLLVFSLYVSLSLKWVSCRQHIYGSYFVSIQPICAFCLEHLFNLNFTFKVIIIIDVPTAIFLNWLGFVFVGLLLFSCGLMTIFSVVFELHFSFLFVYLLQIFGLQFPWGLDSFVSVLWLHPLGLVASLLWAMGTVIVVLSLDHCGMWDPSSPRRDQTRVPCKADS